MYKLHKFYTSECMTHVAKKYRKEMMYSKKQCFTENGDNFWRFFLKTLMQIDDSEIPNEFCNYSTERKYANSGKVFFVSDQLVDNLMDSKFSAESDALLDYKYLNSLGTFQLCFESGLWGTDVHSVLVEVGAPEDRLIGIGELMTALVETSSGKANPVINAERAELLKMRLNTDRAITAMGVSIPYDGDLEEGDLELYEDAMKRSYEASYEVHCCLRTPREFPEMHTRDTLMGHVAPSCSPCLTTTIGDTNICDVLRLDTEFSITVDEDRLGEELADVLRVVVNQIVARILIYLCAEPDALQPGIPPIKASQREMKSPKPHIIGGKLAKRRVGHRRAHFRNLKAARYYQGEHAEKPIGSRWVLVSEVENIDPYTVG